VIMDLLMQQQELFATCSDMDTLDGLLATAMGSSRQEGRLEVYHNGIWGNVCDNGFTNAAARVICHMLGYGHVGWFIGNRYGDGSGPT